MTRQTLLLLSILIISVVNPKVSGQCLSDNDKPTSDNSATVHSILDSSSDFGLDMFELLMNETLDSKENVFFSPFSVWSALTMAYMGSGGNTEKELANALLFNRFNKVSVAQAYSSLKYWYLLRSMKSSNFTLNFANHVFIQETEKIRKCMSIYFSAELSNLNFVTFPEMARSKINDWVSSQTNEKIRDLLPPASINPDTKMVIVNAAYFKSNWLTEFDEAKTKKDMFFVDSKTKVEVDMMKIKGDFPVGYNEEIQSEILELPYAGDELSMYIILPDGVPLEDVSMKITTAIVKSFKNDLFETEIEIILPKFKLEQTFELSDTLQKMGLYDMFDPAEADLSGFTGKKNIVVGAVHHKSYIEVTEKGTEAAAASSMIAYRMARPLHPQVFSANRPFIFIIYEKLADSLLFMGALRQPPNDESRK